MSKTYPFFRITCCIDQMGAWYDYRIKQEVMNLLILKQLQQAVGSFGLTGLDNLLSFMIVKEVQVWQLFAPSNSVGYKFSCSAKDTCMSF